MDSFKFLARISPLFFTFTLHTLIFGAVQWPGTFIDQEFGHITTHLKFLFYAVAISISFFHQRIAKAIGIKKTLITGLVCNALGILCIAYHQFWRIEGSALLLYLAMILMGSALLSVFNCLITYIILAFPKRTGVAIAVLCGCGNLGILLSGLFLKFSDQFSSRLEPYLLLWMLQATAIWCLQNLFIEPRYPQELVHLRSNSLLFREMYRRLPLYFLATLFYGLAEGTMSLWGRELLLEFYSLRTARGVLFFYWSGLLVGQIGVAMSIYYYRIKPLFYLFVSLSLASLLWIPLQSHLVGFYLGFLLGGLGISVVFPLILSRLESEIIKLSFEARHSHYLPLIETGVSFMASAYIFGVGLEDFWITLSLSAYPNLHFFFAALCVLITAVLIVYLHKTRGNIKIGKEVE